MAILRNYRVLFSRLNNHLNIANFLRRAKSRKMWRQRNAKLFWMKCNPIPRNGVQSVSRIFFPALFALLWIVVSGPADAAEKDTLGSLGIPVEDYRWGKLEGASKKPVRPLTIEQLSKVHKELGRNIDPKTIWGSLDNSTLSRNVSCMKATGDGTLCRCLGKTLPAYMLFSSYVSIVTGDKNLNFSGMSAEDIKKVIEVTIDAREKCVAD